MNLTTEAKLLIGTGLATLLILVGGIYFITKSEKKTTELTQRPVDQSILVRPDSYQIATDSAKTTIIEFSDLQCPACASAYPVVKKVLADFSGKVNFVYRHFPLPQHQFGLIAAEAVEAAGVQGKFWEMHDMMYENQQVWSTKSDPMEEFLSYAKNLNLDVDTFKKDVQANKFADKIQRDIVDGNSLGVNSTPTFYVNGVKLSSYSYEIFKSEIEANLK